MKTVKINWQYSDSSDFEFVALPNLDLEHFGQIIENCKDDLSEFSWDEINDFVLIKDKKANGETVYSLSSKKEDFYIEDIEFTE